MEYSFWNDLVGLSPAVHNSIIVVGSLVVMYVRTKKQKKHTALEIYRAREEQKIEDLYKECEREELCERVEDLLNIVYGRMYNAMEEFIFSSPIDGWKDISIIREKSKNDRNPKEFLSEHHSATKSVLFKRVKPFIVKQLNNHNVAETTQETATNDAIAAEVRSIILSEIHKRAGSNTETKAVEDTVITFECILDTYVEISKECVLLRHKRIQDTATAMKAVK